jgi:hypothetical protein
MILKLFSDWTLSVSDLFHADASGRPGGSLLCIGSRTGLYPRLVTSHRTCPVNLQTLLDFDRMPLERVRSIEEHVRSMD